VVLTIILTQIAIFLGIYLIYRLEKRRFFDFLKKNLDPGKPSQIYGVTDVIAKQLAQAAISSLKMGDLNKSSQAVRQEKAMDAAIVKDMIDMNNPGLGALIKMLPNVNKWVGKNPDMAALAAQKLGSLMQSRGNGSAVSTEQNTESVFEIQ